MILTSSKHLFMALSHSFINEFTPKIEASICFIEHKHKILLLKSSNKDIENNKWGVPGGKIYIDENPVQAIKREVFEETGIKLYHLNQDNFMHTIYVRTLGVDAILHTFQVKLPNVIHNYEITLDYNEHCEYLWASPFESLKLDLIKGEPEIIELLYTSQE